MDIDGLPVEVNSRRELVHPVYTPLDLQVSEARAPDQISPTASHPELSTTAHSTQPTSLKIFPSPTTPSPPTAPTVTQTDSDPTESDVYKDSGPTHSGDLRADASAARVASRGQTSAGAGSGSERVNSLNMPTETSAVNEGPIYLIHGGIYNTALKVKALLQEKRILIDAMNRFPVWATLSRPSSIIVACLILLILCLLYFSWDLVISRA